MEYQSFPLLVYLATIAYLAVWLIFQGRKLVKRKRVSGFVPSQSILQNLLFGSLVCVGCILGVASTLWIGSFKGKEGLLMVILALVPVVEGLQSTAAEERALAVWVFLQGLRQEEGGFFDRLANGLECLPAGLVLSRLREMFQNWRSGQTPDTLLPKIRRIDPFLDELILALRLFDFQMGPGMNIVLERLILRAAIRWDRSSRMLRLKKQLFPWLVLINAGQFAFLGSAVLLWEKPFPQGWLSFGVALWFGFILAGLVLLVWFGSSHNGLKRVLVLGFLGIGLMLLIPSVQMPEIARLSLTVPVPGNVITTDPIQANRETGGVPWAP